MVNKKNTAIAGIVVLLCTALVFLGCEEASSSSPAAEPAAPAPAAPEVTATPADGQVTLSWTAVTGATSYKVYQGTSDNEITITGTSAVVTGLTNVQPYSFWVAAVNSGGSTLSAEVTATPMAAVTAPATAPTGLTAAAGVEEVVLAWTAVTGATSYKVYQGGTALDAAITMPTHTVTGLTAGTAHSFTVSAVNSAGEGPQSSAASATPTPAVPAGLAAQAGERTGGAYMDGIHKCRGNGLQNPYHRWHSRCGHKRQRDRNRYGNGLNQRHGVQFLP